MADEVQIDSKAFFKRTSAVLSRWTSTDVAEDERLSKCDAVVIMMGTQSDESNPYSKVVALHTWMLGYEFPSTLMVFTKKGLTVVTSSGKAKLLEPFKKNKEGIEIDVIRRSKDDAENATAWEAVYAKIKAAGTRIGQFVKEDAGGKVAEEWKKVFDEKRTKDKLEEVDVSIPFASLWACKDEEEQRMVKTAAKMSSVVLSKFFVDEMSSVLDENKKVTHEKLALRVEDKLEDKVFWKKARGMDNIDLGMADWCYTPIIQSGGTYDLKSSAQSNQNRLEGAEGGGVIVASMGLRYRSYCSNVGRTWLVDPHKTQQRNYTFLLELQTEIIDKYLRAGATCKEVYEKATQYIQTKQPNLAKHFVKNVGYGTGLEFRDNSYVLSIKNNRQIRADMTFVLSVAFEGIEDPNHKGKTYALSIIDTVKTTSGAATFLTERLSSVTEGIFFKEDEDEESEVEAKKASPSKKGKNGKVDGIEAGGKVLRNRSRGDQMDATAADKFKAHQRELAIQKQEDGLSRFAEQDKEGDKENGKSFKKFESYKKDHMMPLKTRDLRIFIDHKAQTLLLPIYGFSVPFHINTLKNVSKSDEGDMTYLRFNFIAPGQIAGKKEDVPFEDPDATFVRSMSFRSNDSSHFTELYREISELKKAVSKEEAEKKELADVVEQDKLVLVKGRPQLLTDVFPRPAMDGKRVPGSLEIHQNGLRFNSPIRPDQRIDVLFNNIKHLFYQPCDGEMIVLIHCHLKAPIMVGKKKTKDVQFYREASDVQFDETGNRKRKYRGGDEDEFELEQEERRRRTLLNKEFKAFAGKIEEACDRRITADVPFRELGFGGVPFRTNVLLQPTTDCLVHLSDNPFFVVTLSEIECVHLERVSFGLKNFDMVIINSDFTKAPVHINSIDVKSLDGVKEYLDSCDICVTEGPVNLNWGQILSTIREDPYGFFEEGGWSFLSTDSDSEDGMDSDASASGSDFGDQVDAAEVFDDDSSEGDDDDASDFDSDEDSDEDSGSAVEDDESGEDWDELERKAKRADERKDKGRDSDDDGGRSKKKGANSKRR